MLKVMVILHSANLVTTTPIKSTRKRRGRMVTEPKRHAIFIYIYLRMYHDAYYHPVQKHVAPLTPQWMLNDEIYIMMECLSKVLSLLPRVVCLSACFFRLIHVR